MSSRFTPPNTGVNRFDRARSSLPVLGVQADRKGVDARKFLEATHCFPMTGHRPVWADIPESEDGGPVADNGDGVPLDRQGIRLAFIFGDCFAHSRHARSIDPRQIFPVFDRYFWADLNFTAQVDVNVRSETLIKRTPGK